MNTEGRVYDIAIIGGGVTGTAQAYVFTHFVKGISNVLLLEKNENVALVNSNTDSNAQTLHGGDTETNFSLEKALKMRDAECILGAFLEKYGEGAYRRLYKMALAVGADEVRLIKERFKMIHSYYPTLEFLGRESIARIEPKLVEGRNPETEVAALFRPNGFAVDYHRASECLYKEAMKSGKLDAFFKTKTRAITRTDGIYEIETNNAVFHAKAVAVAAGPFSILFAHSCGYAGEYTILPVAGNFYRTRAVILGGKVYTVQDPMFPFAAAHMDSSINDPSAMRIGPTADVIPFLERRHWATIADFLKTGVISKEGLRAIFEIIFRKDEKEEKRKVLRFAGKNVVYKIPVIGTWYFLKKAAQKIIPTLRYRDLEFARGEGGVRPQLVNMKTRALEMGTAKIVGDRDGDKLVFDITPSPGASDCLRNALVNAKKHFVPFLGSGYEFDDKKFTEEFPGAREAFGRIA